MSNVYYSDGGDLPAVIICLRLFFELMADRTRYLKENPEGVNEMCRIMEEMINESLQQGIKQGMKEVALRMLAAGKYAFEEIANISGLSLDEVKNLKTVQSAAIMIREAEKADLNEILKLYLFLHEESIPEQSQNLSDTWKQILEDENHHMIVNEVDGKIVSSCACVIIPNLTRKVRPYALVENVVTHIDYRGQGLASQCLEYAKNIARQNNCYKIMLLTGSSEKETLDFYRNAGFNSTDKTAFIQWLDL